MAKIVVIAGPSGSGKNTVINQLLKRIPHSDKLVTATTRLPRPSEVEGSDYYFLSMERFDEELSNGRIVGQRFVPLNGGVHYGIYLPDLKRKLETASVLFAPVDITGAEYLKEHYGALTIFIMPESIAEYRTRIRNRSREMPQKEFDLRMKITDDEVHTHASRYDYRVVNASGMLIDTVEQVIEILTKRGYTH